MQAGVTHGDCDLATSHAKPRPYCQIAATPSANSLCHVFILPDSCTLSPRLLLRRASYALRGDWLERLAVHRVLDKAGHHFVVGRLTEAHGPRRIGVVFITTRVVEVTRHHESG